MIFIGGMPRAGTSVMTECLRLSGYNIGDRALLRGHKYRSEYNPFFSSLEWMITQRNINEVAEKGYLSGELEEEILYRVADYTLRDKLDVLKVIKLAFVFPWIEHELFENPKFILMHRDFEEAAESYSRLHRGTIPLYYEQKTLRLYWEKWMEVSKGQPRVLINHSDLIHNTDEVKERLSVFLGREVDTSIITPKNTFKESGVIN